MGIKCQAFELDIQSDDKELRNTLQLSTSNPDFSKIDLFINNCGVCTPLRFDQLSMEQIEKMIDLNLKSTIRMTKICLDFLNKNGSKICFVTSMCTTFPTYGLGLYASTKSGLSTLADYLNIELEHKNIRVQCITPADMLTPGN